MGAAVARARAELGRAWLLGSACAGTAEGRILPDREQPGRIVEDRRRLAWRSRYRRIGVASRLRHLATTTHRELDKAAGRA
jgi:hypothetical protein